MAKGWKYVKLSKILFSQKQVLTLRTNCLQLMILRFSSLLTLWTNCFELMIYGSSGFRLILFHT